jgi:hypothetical protein
MANYSSSCRLSGTEPKFPLPVGVGHGSRYWKVRLGIGANLAGLVLIFTAGNTGGGAA